MFCLVVEKTVLGLLACESLVLDLFWAYRRWKPRLEHPIGFVVYDMPSQHASHVETVYCDLCPKGPNWKLLWLGTIFIFLNDHITSYIVKKQDNNLLFCRWQGVEKFVPVHYLDTLPSADWEVFSVNGDTYLVYANAKNNISQMYKVKLS